MNNYCVYKHTSPNGKVYIGITNQKPERRWRDGLSGYRANEHFVNAIKKYGWDNFAHEILYENLSKEEACRIEIELIQQYKSYLIKFGYNQSLGGEHGNHSDETKKKIKETTSSLWQNDDYRKHMSDAHKGQCRKGWHHTDEAKQKMSEMAKERCNTAEFRERMSKQAKAKCDNNPNFTRELAKMAWANEETRNKLIESKRGNHYRAKRVICVETGVVFESALAAAKSLNVSRESIGQCCRGEREMSHGYHWKFYDE